MYKETLYEIIDNAFMEGVITEKQYDRLNERISNMNEFESVKLINESIDCELVDLTEQVVAIGKKVALKNKALLRAAKFSAAKSKVFAARGPKVAKKILATKASRAKVALKKAGVGATQKSAPWAFRV
jgi:hypothetical protein